MLLIVPVVIVPIIVLGRRLRRLSRENQDWIAASSGNASEALLSVQTVQAFTHEERQPRRLRRGDRAELRGRAPTRIGVRAVMTVIVIALVFAGIVGVLWIGARDVRAELMTVGELVQFVIYAVMVAGSVGALSEIWGELQRAAGATERLVELLQADRRGAGSRRRRSRCRARWQGAIELRGRDVPLSRPPRRRRAGRRLACGSPRARRSRWSAPRAPARPR